MANETDTIAKAINSNNIRQGDPVCGATVRGTYHTEQTQVNRVPSLDRVNDKKKNKFTNTDYYSS